MKEGLHEEFEKAYELASTTNKKIAPDDMLRLYAYYKQATSGVVHQFQSSTDIVRSFKFNAWQQVRHLSVDEAKNAYIELIKKILS
jgi:diazepam-binding inhibitor (GABA receptor modulator, acyl-CoA-binding protein)